MYFICISYVFHMYFICISYVFHMYFICISYVFHMYFICISYVFHMYFICIMDYHGKIWKSMGMDNTYKGPWLSSRQGLLEGSKIV